MVRNMKVRLIIPECNDWNGMYCNDSGASPGFENRVEILSQAMQEDGISIVVTSHNFFSFYPSCLINAPDFIQKELAENTLSGIRPEHRKPLVIGFDLLTDSISFNPFNGIDSIVTFLNIDSFNYRYVTHIWECWRGKSDCSQKGFFAQNQNRTFEFDGKMFGLLSCGDIARYCHNDSATLPCADIYLDL